MAPTTTYSTRHPRLRRGQPAPSRERRPAAPRGAEPMLLRADRDRLPRWG